MASVLALCGALSWVSGTSSAVLLHGGWFAAGLILTWLIVTTGGSATPTSAVGIEDLTDESLLRPLAAALVLLAAHWFGALAASRLERS